MKKIDYLKVFILLLALTVTGCSKSSADLEYLTVKYEGEKLWSIVDKDGKDICRDEISGSPSLVINDILTVQNRDDEYEYYNIKDMKKPIAEGSYIQAGLFHGDVTFAVKRNGRICIIDRNCKVVKELPDKIRSTYIFSEGLAVYKDNQGKYGFINEKGDIVINAKWDFAQAFSDGVAVVTKESDSDYIRYAIDTKGNELFKFKSGYVNVGGFSDGLIIVSYMADDESKFVMLNKKGEREKELKRDGMSWLLYADGICIFCNKDDLYGLMNPDGEVIVNAKYEGMMYLMPDRYAVLKNDKAGVINKKGDTVLDFEYGFVSMNCMGKDKFVVKDGKQFYIVNEKGKALNMDAYEDVSMECGSLYFESDYLDVNAIVAHVFSNVTGVVKKGINQGITAAELAKKLNITNASAYGYSSTLNVSDSIISDITGAVSYMFTGNVTVPIRETVTQSSFWGSYQVEKTVGYKFSDSATLFGVMESFNLGKYTGHKKMIMDALKSELLKNGFKADAEDSDQADRFVSSTGYCIIGYNEYQGKVSLDYYFEKK